MFLLKIILLLVAIPAVAGTATAATKTITESGDSTRTMSVTLNVDTAMEADDIITISGLTGSDTSDSDYLTLGGAASDKFSTPDYGSGYAVWTQDSGTLVLTANTNVNANTNITFTFDLDVYTPQVATSPTIATTFAGGNLAETPLVGSNILAKGPTIEEGTIQETGSTTRKISISLQIDYAMEANDIITISGLTGSDTPDGDLTLGGSESGNDDSAKFTANGIDGKGTWTKATGTLVLTLNTGVTASTMISFSVDVAQPNVIQAAVSSPTISGTFGSPAVVLSPTALTLSSTTYGILYQPAWDCEGGVTFTSDNHPLGDSFAGIGPQTVGVYQISVGSCQLQNQVVVMDDLSITGTNTSLTVITAAEGKRHFYNSVDATLTLTKLKLVGGSVFDTMDNTDDNLVDIGIGGSILMFGGASAVLTIDNCIFENNQALAGGAIFYYATNTDGTCSDSSSTSKELCLGQGSCSDDNIAEYGICLQAQGETWTSTYTWSLTNGQSHCGSVTITNSKFKSNKNTFIPQPEMSNYALIPSISPSLVVDFGTGGAMYIGSAHDLASSGGGANANTISVTNSLFESNAATISGGAAYIVQAQLLSGKSVTFTDTVFSNNMQSPPEEVDPALSSTAFNVAGGAIAFVAMRYGGINDHCEFNLITCKFIGNIAQSNKGHNFVFTEIKPTGASDPWMPMINMTSTNTLYADTVVMSNTFYTIGASVSMVDVSNSALGVYLSEVQSTMPEMDSFQFTSDGTTTCNQFPTIGTGVITISSINSGGVLSTSPGTGFIYSYAKNDIISITGCSQSTNNNGNFRISSISGDDITLVHKNTNAAIETGTDETDCTIARAIAIDISTCMQTISDKICCEKTPEISLISPGTGTTLGSTSVLFTGVNFDEFDPPVAVGVITISSITTGGIYTTESGSGTIASFAVDDVVIIASCSHIDSLINNGAFKIAEISGDAITLVNKDTFAAIVTGTDATGCTISNPNIVISTNDNIWSSPTRVNTGELAAVSPIGVGGNIPIKVAINGVTSKYELAFFSYTLPNITLIHTIPKLNGGSSSRLHVIADEIGDNTTLDEISIIIAAEGASACGGTACTNLNLVAVTAIADDVIIIVGVTTTGVYTLAGDTSSLAVGNIVTISGCGDSGSLINNGKFKISATNIDVSNGYSITLVNKDTDASIATGDVPDGCKISREPYNKIDCLYTTAGAKSACMDVVLSAGNQKSPPRTFCYGNSDEGAIIITENVPDVVEGTSNTIYKLNLKYEVARTESVVIAITVTNTVGSLPCTVSPTSVTFDTTDTNDVPITITTTGNDIDEGTNEIINTCTITHTISTTDPVYSLVSTKSIDINVRNDDNADVYLWYDQTYPVKFLAFYAEESKTVIYDIKLETEPTADVTVTIDIVLDPLNEIKIANDVITITGVTTNGVYTTADGTPLGTGIGSYGVNDIVTIASCSVNTENNGFFKISDISGNDITLINRFTNAAIVTGIDITDCTISKSRMHPSPTPNIAITPISSDLTFTSSNWGVYQTVNLTSINDNIDHDLARFTILHTISSSDTVFVNKINAKKSILAVIDVDNDDTTGIVWSYLNDDLTLIENGNSKRIQVSGLNSQPVSDVTITVEIPSDWISIIKVTPHQITISKHEWNDVENIFTFHALLGAPMSTSVGIKLKSSSTDMKYAWGTNIATIAAYVSTAADEPTTNVTNHPPKHSAWTTATFEFYAPESNVVKFVYRLDGGEVQEIPCPVSTYCNKVSFETLALDFGMHRLEVQAASNERLDTTAVSIDWTILHCNGEPQRYAKIEPNGAIQCFDCPQSVGVNCAEMDAEWEHIYAYPNWWTSGSSDDNYFKCPLEGSCLGGLYEKDVNGTITVQKSRCAEGYDNSAPVCAVCADEYVFQQNRCVSCPGYVPGKATAPTRSMMVAGFVTMCFSLVFMYFFFTIQTLSLAEEEDLRVKLSELDLDEVFKEKKELTHDVFSEFLDGEGLTETEILYIFHAVDKDESGLLNRAELEAYVTNNGKIDMEELQAKNEEHHNKIEDTQKVMRQIGGTLMKFKILLGYSQCMTYLPVVFDLPFPPTMTYLMILLEMTSLDIYVLFGEASCYMQTNFKQKFVFHMLLFPVIALMVCFVLGIIYWRTKGCCKRPRFTLESVKTRLYTFATLTCFGLYTGISTRIFRLFKCRNIDDEYYLTSDYSMKCYTDEWWSYAGVAIFCMFVYVVGIPLAQFIVLLQNRHHLHEESALDHQSHRLAKKKFGSIYENYIEDCYYFDLLDLLRRLILTGGLILVGEHSIVQVLLGILTSLFWLLIVAIKFPYRAYWDNILSLALSFALVLSLICGFALELFDATRLANNESVDGTKYEEIIFDWILTSMTLVCIFAGIIACILTIPCIQDCLRKYISKELDSRREMKEWVERQKVLVKWLHIDDVKNTLKVATATLEEKAEIERLKHGQKLKKRRKSLSALSANNVSVLPIVDTEKRMFSTGSLVHIKKMKTIAGHHAEVGNIKRKRVEGTKHLKRKHEEVRQRSEAQRRNLEKRIQRRKSQNKANSNKKSQPESTKKKEKVAEVRESLKEFKHVRAKAIHAKKVGDMVLAMTLLKKCKEIKTIIIKKNDEAEKCDNKETGMEKNKLIKNKPNSSKINKTTIIQKEETSGVVALKKKPKRKKKKIYISKNKMTLAKTKDHIAGMYEKKVKSDVANDKKGNERDTLTHFCDDFFSHMFGMPALAGKKVYEFKQGIKRYAKDDTGVRWFGTLIGWLPENVHKGIITPFKTIAIDVYLFLLQNVFPVDSIEELLDDDPCLINFVKLQNALDMLFKNQLNDERIITLKKEISTINHENVEFNFAFDKIMRVWYSFGTPPTCPRSK